jgi:hypothetical protein
MVERKRSMNYEILRIIRRTKQILHNYEYLGLGPEQSTWDMTNTDPTTINV